MKKSRLCEYKKEHPILATITCQDVVDYLNDLDERDQDAIDRIVETEVCCNSSIAEGSRAIVTPDQKLTFVGILNGFFEKERVGRYDPPVEGLPRFVLCRENEEGIFEVVVEAKKDTVVQDMSISL
jgi:hypothetical protein